MKKKFIVLAISFLLLGLVFGFYFYIYPPISLELVGEEKIILGSDSVYEEPGYKGLFSREDISSSVVVSGTVGSEIGNYELTYTLTKGLRTITKKRVVIIKDGIKPSISLKGPNHLYLKKGNKYSEFGYEASDNIDSEVKVEVLGNIDSDKKGSYTLTYKAIDSSNNESSVTRVVEVVDEDLATSIPVLMYHFFYDASKGQKGSGGNYTEIGLLDQELKYLVDNGYYFPSWEEIELYLDKKIALPKKSIVITIDDGNSSVYNTAYPVIKKYNVPVTVFAITSWSVPKQESFPLISFQSHTHNMHRGGCNTGQGGLLQCVDEKKGLEDLNKSRELTYGGYVFCYPFGDYNDYAIGLLKKSGFKMAFTVEGGRIKPGMDKYKLPRVRVSGGISMNYFKKITG